MKASQVLWLMVASCILSRSSERVQVHRLHCRSFETTSPMRTTANLSGAGVCIPKHIVATHRVGLQLAKEHPGGETAPCGSCDAGPRARCYTTR
eukprot:scaffold616_cov257-Pinguiococcus_pyrenoidosus.AAC.26